MKLADSVSGGGFHPNAKNYRSSTDGHPSASTVRQRRGDALVWTGIGIAAVSVVAYGLWYLYRLLDSVFAPVLVPMPTGLLTAVSTGTIIGVVIAVVGYITIRTTRTSSSGVAGGASSDNHGLAA